MTLTGLWNSIVARACLALAVGLLWTDAAFARTRIKDICRVKGQEENTIQGLGLVVGLDGTGDGEFSPTMRSLAKALELMGVPLGEAGPRGQGGIGELKDAKNVALVLVTATIPAGGARQGDQLDCTVSSIGKAKSLAGGRLFLTPLMGPQAGNPRVFAFADGMLQLDDVKIPKVARAHRACRLEEDFFNPFTKDGKITLVLDKTYVDFQVAQDLTELINTQVHGQSSTYHEDGLLAKAVNAGNIEVKIPDQYKDDPVLFVSQVLSLPVYELQTESRVVINERAGTIVIGADVEIGPVVVTHKNIIIGPAAVPPDQRFVGIDTVKKEATRLQGLVSALNAVKVPNNDIIEIIKRIHQDGKLYGKLVIE